MSSRLGHITDLKERAARAGFHVSALASQCGVSEQHLRRYIESKFGQPPHIWMMNQRLRLAPKLLGQGLLVKEVSDKLGFKKASHFSREFKKHYGVSPRSFPLPRRRKAKDGTKRR